MFHQGNLQSAVNQALTQAKLLVVFVRDNSQMSSNWEQFLLGDAQITNALSRVAVVLRAPKNSTDAANLSLYYPVASCPVLLILLNGRVVEYLEPGYQPNELKSMLLKSLGDANAASSHPVLEALDQDVQQLASNNDHTIHPFEVATLEQRGVLTASRQGTRQISSSTILSESSASSGNFDVGSVYPIEIPETMTSAAALRYVGFTDNQASAMFDRWHSKTDWPWDLEQTVLKEIKHSDLNAEAVDDDWEGVMIAWGIKPSLRAAILNPEFTDIRSTRTAKFWVTQSITRGFSSLELIRHASQERLLKSRYGIHAMRRPGSQFPAPLTPIISLRGGAVPPATAESQREPGSTVLFRGMDIKDTEDLIDDSTGQYNCAYLLDTFPTDFHGPGGWISYFGLERWVAEKYAKYTKQLVDVHRTCIVEMTIPNSLISRMDPVILRYNDAWKKIIWTSRRGKIYPKELQQFYKRPLYIGDICHNYTPAITKMASWTQLTRKNVMAVDDEVQGKHGQMTTVKKNGTQFAFFGDDMPETLAKECSFRILRSKAG